MQDAAAIKTDKQKFTKTLSQMNLQVLQLDKHFDRNEHGITPIGKEAKEEQEDNLVDETSEDIRFLLNSLENRH